MRESDENDDGLRGELLDSMLAEAVGGVAAPDLRGRIALEFDATTTDPVLSTHAPSVGPATAPDSRWVRRAVMALAAGFLLAFVGWFAVRGRDGAVAVELAVVEGELDYIAEELRRHFVSGDKADILLAVGDRFSTAVGGGAVLHLQPLGILTLTDHATVEILTMNWTKRDNSLVLASLTVGAIAGGFTWNSIMGKRVEAGDSQPLVAADAVENIPEKPDPLIADLRHQIASLKKRNAALEIGLQRHKIAEAEVEEQEPDETKPLKIVALFEDPEFGDALAKIDWTTMGVNLSEMLPMLGKLAEAIANGEEIPIDVAGEIQKRNGDLVVIAKAIMDAKIPGAGINGAFSHPSVVSNQIGAVLEAAGLSLDAGQKENMERIRSVYAAKDRSLRSIAASRDLELENLMEEVEFKRDFYNEARAILSADQRALLWSDASRGRSQLDVFDTGIVLSLYAKPVKVKDASELAAMWSGRLGSKLTLDAAGKRALNGILASYADRFPASFWEQKPDALDRMKMMKSSRIHDALRRQVDMMNQIMNTMSLSAEDRARLKKSMFVLVPYPR